MEPKQPATIYLKRRMLARDYFAQVPEALINMDDWVRPCNDDILGIGQRKSFIEAHLAANGLDAIKCGTTACLAGWLWTMPEYKEWCQAQFGQQMADTHGLRQWLGLDPYDPAHEQLFAAARGCYYDDEVGADTEKAIALNRLDMIIKQAMPDY